jgi:hypothetical protein
MFLSMLKIAAVGILESITDVFLHKWYSKWYVQQKKLPLELPTILMQQLINFSDYIEKYYCRRALTQ